MSSPNPLVRNRFQVQWGGARTSFAEVSGLAIEMKTADYRDGNSPEDTSLTMPGIISHPHLVLKRTVVAKDNDFYNWMNSVQFSSVTRRDVTVELLDSGGNPVVVWKFINAYPVKLEYSGLESQNSGPMFETLQLAYDSMTVVMN
ncbi:MAG TPA: phage tail protein [Opitutaceae bacterium]|jgi:phage tail-like protein